MALLPIWSDYPAIITHENSSCGKKKKKRILQKHQRQLTSFSTVPSNGKPGSGEGMLIMGERVCMREMLIHMRGDGAHHRAAAGGAGSRGVPAVFRGLWIEGTEDQRGTWSGRDPAAVATFSLCCLTNIRRTYSSGTVTWAVKAGVVINRGLGGTWWRQCRTQQKNICSAAMQVGCSMTLYGSCKHRHTLPCQHKVNHFLCIY